MSYLITLKLDRKERNLAHIKSLFSNLKSSKIDDDYGIVTINPKQNLYAIRVFVDVNENDLETFRDNIREIDEIYIDIPMETCVHQ